MNLLLILVALFQLTIEQCYDKARENYPLIKKYDLIAKSEEYTLKNASYAYIPRLALAGSATYQSDVVTLPFENLNIPGLDFNPLSKDQYAASIELTQLIWDGGASNISKDRTKAETAVSYEELEVEMYGLRERVNDLYFGILMLNEQMNQNTILLDELQENRLRLEKSVENGVANKSDIDVIDVEIVSAKQQRVTMKSLIDAYLGMLSLLVGQEIEEPDVLVKPFVENQNMEELLISLITAQSNRPELRLFDSQINELGITYDHIVSQNMPKFSLFIKGGYGRPGLDMLSNEFDFFAVGGVRMVWDLGNLYYLGNGKKLIENAVEQVNTMRETFLFNMDLMTKQTSSDYERYLELLKSDKKVVELRKRIREKTEIEMELGTKTASDLMTDMTKEQMAIQEIIIHEIELLKTLYELKNIKNN